MLAHDQRCEQKAERAEKVGRRVIVSMTTFSCSNFNLHVSNIADRKTGNNVYAAVNATRERVTRSPCAFRRLVRLLSHLRRHYNNRATKLPPGRGSLGGTMRHAPPDRPHRAGQRSRARLRRRGAACGDNRHHHADEPSEKGDQRVAVVGARPEASAATGATAAVERPSASARSARGSRDRARSPPIPPQRQSPAPPASWPTGGCQIGFSAHVINGLVSNAVPKAWSPAAPSGQRQRDLRRGEQSRCGGSKISRAGREVSKKSRLTPKVLWSSETAGAHALGGAARSALDGSGVLAPQMVTSP